MPESGGQTLGDKMQMFFNVEPKGAVQGLGKVEKAQKRTTDSAKKTGDEGQKSMNKWGKAMDKAGGSAYDFGNQIFSSMTVMEAMKEGATGSLEQYLKGLFDDPAKGIAYAIAGPVGAGIVTAIESVDWGGVGHTISVGLGIDKELSDMTEKAIMLIPLSALAAKAVQAGDWTAAQKLLSEKIATGNYDNIDLAIQEAIGKGDYGAARQLLVNQIGGADWSELSEPFFTGITSKMDVLNERLSVAAKEVFKAMEGGLSGVAEGPSGRHNEYDAGGRRRFPGGDNKCLGNQSIYLCYTGGHSP